MKRIKKYVNNGVQYIQVNLDGRIPLKLIQTDDGESVIFCKKFEEQLFETGFFSTKEKDFVHNYVTEAGEKYIVSDVTMPSGEIKKNVKFKVVISEEKNIPFSTFSTAKPQLIEEKRNDLYDQFQSIIKKQQETKKAVEKAKLIEKQIELEKNKLLVERRNIENEKKQVENEKIVANKLEDYKQQLLEEFINISDKQKCFVEKQIENNFKNLKTSVDKETDTLKKVSENFLIKLNEDNIEKFKSIVETKIQKKNEEINSILEKNRETSVKILLEKTEELKQLFEEKFVIDLQEYKENLAKEFNDLAEENVNKFILENKVKIDKNIKEQFIEEKKRVTSDLDKSFEIIKSILEKTSDRIKSKEPELNEKIKIIDEKILQLVDEKKNNFILVNEAKSYTDKQILKAIEDSKNYARRILDLGGGGGSNAVQLVNGGTINGDLNINGKYLSAGIDLISVFSAGGGGFDNQNVNSLVQSKSAAWNSVYSNVNDNSAYWADTRYNVKFDQNVTILGNLTAKGTATFANTIFTTTSALSVVNTGPGPALYLYQAAGPYDVASFYDGDGIEVLHVGNAQGGGNPLGKVGINESFPSAELTVRGNLSASGSINATGYNDANWNNVYNNVRINSAGWEATEAKMYASSASWNSVYSTVNTNSAVYGSMSSKTLVASSFNGQVGYYYLVNTTSNLVSCILPASPKVGDTLRFQDPFLTWTNNNFILNNNNLMIEGTNDELACNLNGLNFSATYVGGSVGWRIN